MPKKEPTGPTVKLPDGVDEKVLERGIEVFLLSGQEPSVVESLTAILSAPPVIMSYASWLALPRKSKGYVYDDREGDGTVLVLSFIQRLKGNLVVHVKPMPGGQYGD